MQHVIERAKNIIVSPREALTAVKVEPLAMEDVMKNYVAIIAAIPAAAAFIGLIGRTGFFRIIGFVVVSYLLNLLAVFIFGKILNALAPKFNSMQNDIDAFKLSVYAFTPGFVAGVFNINPALSILAFLGWLYGLYVLYLGIPVLMETPGEKVLPYAVVSIVLQVIVMVLISLLATAITLGGGMGLGRV